MAYQLTHELPHNCRLKILMIFNFEPKPSLPLRNKTLAIVVKKMPKKRTYQTFLVLSNFTEFLCFVPNILPRIVKPR